MKTKTLKSDVLLILAAIIWGFAFVAQRVGMDYVGPFTFTGIRFALGVLGLVFSVHNRGIYHCLWRLFGTGRSLFLGRPCPDCQLVFSANESLKTGARSV